MMSRLPKSCRPAVLAFFLVFLMNPGKCNAVVASGVSFPWVADFTRQVVKSSTTETQQGVIHYLAPHRAIIEVSLPLKQWIIVGKDTTTVFYPVENRALRFVGKRGFDLSIIELFLGLANGDFGLSLVGFKLESSQLVADTLVTWWKPPETSGAKGRARIRSFHDIPFALELLDGEGNLTRRTTCAAFHEERGVRFPTEIVQVTHFGSDSTVEAISYTNVQFNPDFPESSSAFHLPEGVAIQEIEW